MELAQDRDQALFVDELFLGAQGLATAQLFQHVVHAGYGQPGVQGLAGVAVGFQVRRESADMGLLGLGGIGKGKGIEGLLVLIAGIVADAEPATRRDGPDGVDPAGQHAKDERVRHRNGHHRRIRYGRRRAPRVRKCHCR